MAPIAMIWGEPPTQAFTPPNKRDGIAFALRGWRAKLRALNDLARSSLNIQPVAFDFLTQPVHLHLQLLFFLLELLLLRLELLFQLFGLLAPFNFLVANGFPQLPHRLLRVFQG